MSQKTRKNKTDIFKCVASDYIFVGVDVHKSTYHLAVRKNGALAASWVMPHDDTAFVKMLLPARKFIKKVVYEAGPTGYCLARSLISKQIPVSVVAPGKTPRVANENNKSDKLDCKKLAEYAEKGLLQAVAIPTELEDAERAVTRRLDAVKSSISKVKTSIKSFLLNYSLVEPRGLKTWTLTSINDLWNMDLVIDLRVVLDSKLRELENLKEEVKTLRRHLQKIQNRHKEEAEIILSHPGVGVETTRHFLAEVFSPHRFNDKREVVAYVGLAPRVSRSGVSCKEGGRLRGGRKKLRACLIEAGWVWVRQDPYARETYNRLLKNTGKAQKAITAIARKILVNIWNMVVKMEKFKRPSIRV